MSSGGKRHRDTEFGDQNGRNKKRNQFTGDREQLVLPTPDDTTYRILCPEAQVGSVIGRGGSIIKSLRQQSRAKIKITDSIPGADERVVLIWSTPKDLVKFKDKGAGREVKEGAKEKDGDEKKREGHLEEGEFLCPAQVALFKVHARIVEGDGGISDNEDEDASRQVTARLLVPNNQIGCLLGKGGKIIEKMRTETRAQIRILPKDQRPGCALPSDELVQISGDYTVVKRAMYQISARIHESPPRDRPQGAASFLPSEPVLPRGGALSPGNFLPPGNSLFGSASLGSSLVGPGQPTFSGYGGYGSVDSGPTWPINSSSFPGFPPPGAPRTESKAPPTEQEFSIRVLCTNDKVGFIIGKGGIAIRQLRESTGARIKVEDPVPDADERVIAISANEYLDDRVSPVIEATLQLQSKAGDVGGENDGTFATRLLVPSKQVGCLLGKKGSIISEMRKNTNANIKISREDGLPKCAQETDELVQIVGEQNVARDALMEILTRLRNHVFKEQIEAQNKSGGQLPAASLPGLSLQGSYPVSSASLGGSYELSSPGRMYSLTGLGLQGGSRYSTSYGGLGSLQGTGSSYGEPLSYGGGLHTGRLTGGGYRTSTDSKYSRGSALTSDGVLKNISSTSVEVTIPGATVSTVLGSRSNNLSRICQFSGAKVKLRDPNPRSGDRTVQIFGTPEQIQAAQSLLQGFIYSGQTPVGSSLRGLY